MIGSLITRGLLLIFGYAYPAYECYKTVELNKPEIEQLRFWCQYWILVALLTVCERIGDMFVGWVPMYSEAKLAFVIYLWFPKTKGTTYVYNSFFRPYVAKHETDIDRNLFELRTRAGDMAAVYLQKAVSYGQTRIFDILQYIASQSNRPRPEAQQQGTRVPKPATPSNHRSTDASQPQDQQPLSPSSTSSATDLQEDDTAEEPSPSHDSKESNPPPTINEQKTTPSVSLTLSTKTTNTSDEQVMEIDSGPSAANENPQPTPQDIVLEDAVRVTRARSRRNRGSAD